MSNNIDSYAVFDLHKDKDIREIHPLSARGKSLIARNRGNEHLKKGFINLLGALEILEGLEYHHKNIIDLSDAIANGSDVHDGTINHEAVAYVNRMGQFYYFAISDFIKNVIPESMPTIPTITKYMVFRHKHSAHRSIDAPKNEDEIVKLVHARSLSLAMGVMMTPKPGMALVKPPDITDDADWMKVFRSDQYRSCHRVFQIFDEVSVTHKNFVIEREHPSITSEAYEVIERVILHK